ncbi:MAG: winged helix-turn-helix domain-containing protein [Archaeoglobaceae archaeon]|nr:winged helix-turn-helix domain-containing protein [Archaeoglobaceae archaeon]MDW7989067.1 winged helix-turn-helix domain-containing protein [Archaeoglobaceae archaeon]
MIEIFTSTRLQILLKLRERPYTISEIAKAMGFSKTAIGYHLEKLVESGMVERVERGKWVYYRLTNKGSSRMKIEILATLSSLLISFISFFTLLLRISKPEVKVERESIPSHIQDISPTPYVTPEIYDSLDFDLHFIALIAITSFTIFLYIKLR